MNRRFLKPLFSFWDPFFSEPIYIRRVLPAVPKANRNHRVEEKKEEDPHETFENFFKDHFENTSTLKAEQKEFFEKHFPEKVGKKFNPYETLGIDQSADIQKIKQAYRTNALKYHPKNNSTPEAPQKFKDVSRAYNELISQKQTNDYGEDVSSKSLFQDFHKELENFSKPEVDEKGKQKIQEGKQQNKINMKTQQKKQETVSKQENSVKSQAKESGSEKKLDKTQQKGKNSILKGAELYSESSFFEFVNGKRKLHVTKMYEKDGKTIKVDRVEQNRPDGTIEVSETFDDGKEVRNKKFIQGANRKQKYLS